MIIALIGSPLAGKTTLLKEFQKKGIKVFSADSFVTQIYKKDNEGYNIIKKELGDQFVTETSVNKRELAKWASIEGNLNILNELIHPIIFNYLEGKDNYIAELPILTKSPVKFKYDKLVMVKASPEKIKERFESKQIMNPLFIEQIIKDWNNDIPFDYVIDTTNDIKENDISNIIKLVDKNESH